MHRVASPKGAVKWSASTQNANYPDNTQVFHPNRRRPFRFTVGVVQYDVCRASTLRFEGDVVAGLIDFAENIIFVSGDVIDPTRVDAILRHEHSHAWDFEAGGSRRDPENRMQFISLVGATYAQDMKRVGGIKAFLKLPIHDSTDAALMARAVTRADARRKAVRCA